MEGRGLSGCGDSTGGLKDVSPQILGPSLYPSAPHPRPHPCPTERKAQRGETPREWPLGVHGEPWLSPQLVPSLFPSRASALFGGILGFWGAHAAPGLDHMTWAEPTECLLVR